MKANTKVYIYLEIISLLGGLIILINRDLKIDLINTIIFFGIIFSGYRLLNLIKWDNVA